MKKMKFALPLVVLLLPLTSCGTIEKYDFVKKEVKIYSGATDTQLTMPTYFSDEYPQIPFINLKDEMPITLLKLLNSDPARKSSVNVDYNITVGEDGSKIILKRENGAQITFDADYNTVYSPSLNKFKMKTYAANPFDIFSANSSFYDENNERIKDQIRLMKRLGKKYDGDTTKTEPGSYYIKGYDVFMDLDAYNINIVKRHGKYYIPFTTFYNICGPTSTPILYNGESYNLGGITSLGYYDRMPGKTKRSKALIDYTYNEFCRDLDYTYGLKDTHNIYDFDSYFEKLDIKKLFYDEKNYSVNKALMYLVTCYIGDLHTSFTGSGAYETGIDTKPRSKQELLDLDPTAPINTSYEKVLTLLTQTLPAIRKDKKITKDISEDPKNPSYVVSNPFLITGDTAIVTFDGFVTRSKQDYYYSSDYKPGDDILIKDPSDSSYGKQDTIALVNYANQEIKNYMNKHPGVLKNVVIDISCNGGGAADAALFIAGWLDSAKLIIEDPNTNERGMTTYQVDVNFDKKYSPAQDSIFYYGTDDNPLPTNLKVYCLTSECSFSCANLLPSMLEQSGKGTIIGTKSGGGACIVHSSGLADGTGFNFSSNYRLCQEKNGNFTHIDEGITPTYLLKSYDTIYGGNEIEAQQITNDRSSLVAFIDSLNN